MIQKYLKIIIPTIVIIILSIFAVFFISKTTTSSNTPLIIWTNRAEFVSYAEYFNATQTGVKVSVVYKESPVESFPPAKDEQTPDLVIGPWLKNEKSRKNFIPLDYLFGDFKISTSAFYPQLFELGNIDDKQYLLPISFNLPVIIFSKDFQNLITDNYILSLDQIKDISSSFNQQNKSGIYTRMGFASHWEQSFLYLATKLRGADFKEAESGFSWNESSLNSTLSYLKNWTISSNTSTSAEDDFKFKYLYTPEYKQITSGKCLFAYITSEQLFSTPEEQLKEIDFRWIHENFEIPIEDQIISLGLYKKSKNTDAAEKFIIWFLQEETQKLLLERAKTMNLQTTTFGISGGFSSIRNVNEHIFPTFYPTLLGNLPAANHLVTPNILPPYWENIKERIIIPYILDSIKTEKENKIKSLDDRITEWNKQYY